jgi:hypothetical protein
LAQTAGLVVEADVAAAAAWVDPLAAAAGVASKPVAIVASMAAPAPTAASLRASPEFMRGCSVSFGSKMRFEDGCRPGTSCARVPRQSLTKACLLNHKTEAVLNTPEISELSRYH